ncbi:chromosome segregation protein SMC [Bifidobacterium vansinderenii]|uniref:Chromosome partition protein Smc n=1 Tax=Bifidobacterium vansinderenii TaxID=1984871 RepID=A0A229VV26_9BIFI|nr:chromosome segregation protein SMC [Bifidobacterium vansinderenii]OXM99451.1 chromosome segregation protein SMC [Bifidobacterium vansinderenii]
MYLKELTLKGFKSFASATTLRFEPGITAVVGPNGSGKSNIVDALTWVMGEQGAKNLRGTSMEDVIFAGTTSRPALGRAQVSLTIDNSDRVLDIDYTEVTISRTMFRGGGSEYEINGTPCRLLDIQELLSDTGLGSHMHVIVGQGRLDQILHADPTGHRAFIEEAAGILKHRKRKERALRKLTATEANLARLDDLLGEIRRQMGPLGRQARISRKADAIQVSVRDAQSRIMADDAAQLIERRDANREELTRVRGELAGEQRTLAEVKIRIEQVEAASRESSPAIAALTATWHEMSQIHERLESLASLADERRSSLLGQITENLGEDPELLIHRADELTAQADDQHAKAAETQQTLKQAQEHRAELERQLASLRQTMAELRKSTRERESRIAQLRELIAREEALLQSATAQRDDINGQRDALHSQLETAVAEQGELEHRIPENDEPDDTALVEARTALEQTQAQVRELEDHRRAVETRMVSLNAKADALADTLDGRNAAGALEQDPQTGALGHLTDFIQVEDGWEEAVSHALDVFAGAIVVADDTNVDHALTRAKSDRLGKAVLLRTLSAEEIADADPTHPMGQLGQRETDTADRADIPGIADLIRINPNAENADAAQGTVRAVRHLVADVAAARSRDEAMHAVRHGWQAAVTMDGELFRGGVAAVGGSALAQSDLSLAARRNRALADVAKLSDELTALDADLAEAKERSEQASELVQNEQTLLAERRLQIQQSRQMLKTAGERTASLRARLETLERKASAIDEAQQEHTLKLNDLNRAMTSMNDAHDAHADIDDLDVREHELDTMLATARNDELAATMAWNEATRQAQSLVRQAGLLRDNAHQAEQRRIRIESLNARRRKQADQAARIAERAKAVAADLAKRIGQVEERRAMEQRSAARNDDELADLRARRDRLEPRVVDLRGREHGLDMNRERMAADYEQLATRISETLGMTVDEAVRDYGPDQPVPVLDETGNPNGQTVYVRDEQVQRLERAKRDLIRLGKVNPLATEEYDALKARNQYLNDQRNDVARSRDDLMALIKQLDSTMVDVFRKAFDDTAEAFTTMFGVLFPGGHGTLKLDNPNDPLNSGVIVQARPAGKRVKRLSLLSGGERSLTALAFLFAIFTARPSPFYVMDEVEAALDDVNLTRLLDAFEKLREHAQLIVITHQQRTMGIADALYGVTMRADGVTAVVSQKLER